MSLSLRMRAGNMRAYFSQKELEKWLADVGDNATKTFRRGMRGSHSGRNGRSAPGEYPANQTGKLIATIKSVAGPRKVTVGTSMYYSIYLTGAEGKLEPRKMSKEALLEGRAATPRRRWAQWVR